MTESVSVCGIYEVRESADLTDEDPMIVANICFDSKRVLGCYVCPDYKCEKRDL